MKVGATKLQPEALVPAIGRLHCVVVGCIVNISDIPATYIFSIEECVEWGETLDMGNGQQGLELWVTHW